VKLITHLHLKSRPRKSGALTPHRQTPSWRGAYYEPRTALLLPFTQEFDHIRETVAAVGFRISYLPMLGEWIGFDWLRIGTGGELL
jgi:hypothetical protein